VKVLDPKVDFVVVMMVERTELHDERAERENIADVMMVEERDHDSVVDSEEDVSQSRMVLLHSKFQHCAAD
jgi:hypothetical protein